MMDTAVGINTSGISGQGQGVSRDSPPPPYRLFPVWSTGVFLCAQCCLCIRAKQPLSALIRPLAYDTIFVYVLQQRFLCIDHLSENKTLDVKIETK